MTPINYSTPSQSAQGREIFYQFCQDKNNKQKIQQELEIFLNLLENFYKNRNISYVNSNIASYSYGNDDKSISASTYADMSRDHLTCKCRDISSRLFGNDPEQERKATEFLHAKLTDKTNQNPVTDRLKKFLKKASEQPLLTANGKAKKLETTKIEAYRHTLTRLEDNQRKELLSEKNEIVAKSRSLIKHMNESGRSLSKPAQGFQKQLIENLQELVERLEQSDKAYIVNWDIFSDNKIFNYISDEIIKELEDIENRLQGFNNGQQGLFKITKNQEEMNQLSGIANVRPARNAIEFLESVTIAAPALLEENSSIKSTANPLYKQSVQKKGFDSACAPAFKSFWEGVLKVKNWSFQLFNKLAC